MSESPLTAFAPWSSGATDRVVVVTGASSGVGRATARAFGARGYSVGLLARNLEALENAAREVEEAGGRALVLATDVADADAVEAAAERAEAELGPIGVWVNVAMAAVLSPLSETSAHDIRRVTEVSYLGFVHGTMAALKPMRARDAGTVVQVGSALSYRSIPLQASYCGAKFAIRGFTDAVRTELMHDGSNVHITMVQLPALNTPQFSRVKTTLPRHPQPVPPVFQPELAADAIVWASEHRRREVWLGGSTYKTILGGFLAPLAADRYLARTSYRDQQTALPVEPDRPDYLHDPVAGDPGAHGIFDADAKDRSLAWTISRHRRAVTLGVVTATALAGISALRAAR
ncbi:MAG: SDR family oxidoreductase [Actinomycetota bacterium]|nr:SDR family oxidoreductase [Actinomycetota bacterium]